MTGTFQSTVYDQAQDAEFEVEITYEFSPAFNGGREEPSREAELEIVSIIHVIDYAKLPLSQQARIEGEALDHVKEALS